MDRRGYNIFVAGDSGMGRDSTVKRFLSRLASTKESTDDWVFVHHFAARDKPKWLKFPTGTGKVFKEQMEELVARLRDEIPSAFEGGDYKERLEALQKESRDKKKEIFQSMEAKAEARGFRLKRTSMGILSIPTWEKKPIDDKAFLALPEDVQQKIKSEKEALQDDLNDLLEEIQGVDDEIGKSVAELDRRVLLFSVGRHIDNLLEEYGANERVLEWLNEVKEDVLLHADQFRSEKNGGMPMMMGMPMPGMDSDFRRYKVNLLVDRTDCQGAPVVHELNPSFPNLVGRTERRVEMGMMTTDFTMIRGGALHEANGGYLVLDALDLLKHPLAWEGLKRALRDECICIEDLAEQMGYAATKSIDPEPIPLDVKVILIGNAWIYHLLYQHDEDFRELFKIRADFDDQYDSGKDARNDYACFVQARVDEEDLLPFSGAATSRLYAYGVRMAGDREKVTTRFGIVTDLMREADQWARLEKKSEVGSEDVRKVWMMRKEREGLYPERMEEMMLRDHIMVSTEGSRVGCVNGLAVYQLAGHAFGKPSRITVNTFFGKSGVVNIEREANLSGTIHTKGLLILSGWLNETFGKEKPIPISATITFEQSYGSIDGDSASSTELYGLLSSLAEVGIDQGIAVTGSVNQKGEIQPIGGANEKIEGFFSLCKSRGLTGTQGVMIPSRNVENLVLDDEVIEAIKEGTFHIWAVSTLEEGVEILTDKKAGVWNPKTKKWTRGSLFAAVAKNFEDRFKAIKEEMKEVGKKKKKGKKKSPKKKTPSKKKS